MNCVQDIVEQGESDDLVDVSVGKVDEVVV